MATTRDLLVDTMKQLLWERGYDATSPNHVLERSGVGKGSFYHHFKSKKDLAVAAMEARADDLIAEFDGLISQTSGDWFDKVCAYLQLPRHALKGCRMGRIVQDPSVGDDQLLAPLERYFSTMHQRFSGIYQEAQQQDKLAKAIPAEALATLTLSVIQGGFVVGKATSQDQIVDETCGSFMTLLESLKRH